MPYHVKRCLREGLLGIALVLLLFMSHDTLAAKYTVTLENALGGPHEVKELDSFGECLDFVDECERMARDRRGRGEAVPWISMEVRAPIPDVWSMSLRDLIHFARAPWHSRDRVVPVRLILDRDPCIYGAHDVGESASRQCDCFGTQALLGSLDFAHHRRLLRLEDLACPKAKSSFGPMNIVLDYLDLDVAALPLNYPGTFLHRSPFYDPEGSVSWIQQCRNRVDSDLVRMLSEATGMCPLPSERPRPRVEWLLNANSTMTPIKTVRFTFGASYKGRVIWASHSSGKFVPVRFEPIGPPWPDPPRPPPPPPPPPSALQ